MPSGTDRIRLNVGGKIFETTSSTLSNAGRSSFLGALLDHNWNPPSSSSSSSSPPTFFIDRNPKCFSVLLDLLRSGHLHLPPSLPPKLLFREALFFGLLDQVRSSLLPPFDANLLHLSSSVPGPAPGDPTAIRASPSGGCCVAHGSLAHLYDWILDHHPPITLDHQPINDATFLDSSHILLAARERPHGGLALFSSSSGDLLHRFPISHDRKAKTFTAGALSFSDANAKIFASCKGRCNEHGLGVWDRVTGEQADFFYQPPGCSFGDADKLQWVEAESFLMVATLFPRTDDCFIGVADFREKKKLVWSWTDQGAVQDEKRVLHAVVMEDGRSICVVNQYEDLGFLDLRSSGGGVRWSSRSRLMKGRVIRGEESCYPKLEMQGGQLFMSMNDSISVFCGPEWVLTSTMRASAGGPICDFSIGGDRLFALHSEENVFDVWETAAEPII